MTEGTLCNNCRYKNEKCVDAIVEGDEKERVIKCNKYKVDCHFYDSHSCWKDAYGGDASGYCDVADNNPDKCPKLHSVNLCASCPASVAQWLDCLESPKSTCRQRIRNNPKRIHIGDKIPDGDDCLVIKSAVLCRQCGCRTLEVFIVETGAMEETQAYRCTNCKHISCFGQSE